ncbi:hypothetical protein Tco_0813088 [Tanacetum coccineum]
MIGAWSWMQTHVHFGQDGLGVFDWSNNADDAPASLALMATKSEVPYCSKCSKSYKQLLENYQTERDNFQKARSRVPQAVLSRSTGRPYYPRMDNRRPRISSYSPSSRSSTTRTPNRPHRPKKIVKSIWVKKGSTVGSQAVLPQNVSIKRSAMITSKQTGRQKGDYLDSVNRDNGSYTLKQFDNPEEILKDYAIIESVALEV